MTTPRKDPYALLIEQFLSNNQNLAKANEQRFQLQREERLIDERRDFQQGVVEEDRQYQDQVREEQFARADTEAARRRAEALTDAANNYRLREIENMRNVMAFVPPDSEEYETYSRALARMGEPLTLTGNEALTYVTSGTLDLGDGETVDLHELIAQGQRIRRDTEDSEEAMDFVRQRGLEYMGNAEIDPEKRMAFYKNTVAGDTDLYNEDVRDAMLILYGVDDPERRRQIVANGDLLDLQARQVEQSIKHGDVQIARDKLALEQEERMNDVTYEDALLKLEEQRSTQGFPAAQGFVDIGFVPADEAAARRLATQLGFDSVDELKAAGAARYARLQRIEAVQEEMLGMQRDLVGVQVEDATLNHKMTNWRSERERLYANLDDTMEMAASAYAAAAQGDIQTLEAMESLAATGMYEQTLGMIDFPGLLDRAKTILTDEENSREYLAWQRGADIASTGLQLEQDLDSMIESRAARMVDMDFQPGEDGEPSEVQDNIRSIVGSFTDRELEAFGTTEEELTERLMQGARRAKALDDEAAAGAAMEGLMGAVPPPEMDEEGNPVPGMTQKQRDWRDTFLSQAELLGMDADIAEQIADGLLSGKDMEFWTSYLDNERVKSVIELNLANARVANLTADQAEQDMNAEDVGVIVDDELYDNLLNGLEAQIDLSNRILESPVCAMSGTTGSGLDMRPDAPPPCQQAFDDLNQATRDLHNLNNAHATQSPFAMGALLQSQQTPEAAVAEGMSILSGMEGVREDNLAELESVDETGYQVLLLALQSGRVTTAEEVNRLVATGLAAAGGQDGAEAEPDSGLSDRATAAVAGERGGMPGFGRAVGDAITEGLLPGAGRAAVAISDFITGQGDLRRLESDREKYEQTDSEQERNALLSEWGVDPTNAEAVAVWRGHDFTPAVESQGPESQRSATQGGSTPGSQDRSPAPRVDQATPELVDALFQQESNGRHLGPDGAVLRNESSGASGIAQAMPITAWQPGYGVDPAIRPSAEDQASLAALNSMRRSLPKGDPEIAVITREMRGILEPYVNDVGEEESRRFGEDYLNAMLEKYDGDLEKALAGYNAGPDTTDTAIRKGGEDWKDHLPRPNETLPYIKNIVSMWRRASSSGVGGGG